MNGGDGSERLRPSDRLRKSRDYRRVSRRGRRSADGTVLILIAETTTSRPTSRLGITVSRKVGRAVVRNRVKRTIREYFRRHRTEFPPGDVVVIARTSAGTAPSAILWRDLGVATERLRAAS